ELAEIKKDLKIDLDLKEADVKNFDFSKVVGLFHELDFKSLLTKLPSGSPPAGGSGQATLFGKAAEPAEPEFAPQLPYEAITDEKRWQEIQEILLNQEILVIDTETTDLEGELIGISFAWDKDSSVYLPLAPAYPGGLPLEKIRSSIQEILGNTEIKKIGHNLKYDLGALRRAGLETRGVWFDTMIASQLVNSQLYSHRLDDLSFSELGFKKISISQLIGAKKDASMATVELDKLAAYSCEDVLITWRLFEHIRKDVEEKSVKKVFYEIEMPLLPVLEEMEFHGIKIDRSYLKELEGQLKERLGKIDLAVHKAAGEQFNVASPIQLQKILFEKLNLSVVGIKKNKNGYSTDADSLEKLKDKHEIVALVLEYREIAKLLNTYIETLPALMDKNDRVHTSYGQIGAATGRLSSNNPNLQNIPIRTDLGNQVRQAFVADTGKVLLGADYSQAELRVLAHLSEDPQLIEAFHNAADFHAAVAERLGVDRRAAKAINFGIIYGLGANALARDIGVKTEVARQFIDKYFETFPGVAAFIEKMKRQAREQGYVETLYGRKRYLPDIQSPNMMLKSAAERMAVNMPNQGTVADLMKLSMVKLQDNLPKEAKMLLQIHDELLFEVEKGAEEKVSQAVKEVMGSIATLKVPLIVDTKAGPNWAQMKPL
ncbi:MAG: DNA polymerase I, partial [Patescibacteria group bacterium]